MFENNLMYKVTWCYYKDDMTQQEIAKHLGISRMKVVKILNQAKRDGIIRFHIDTQAKDNMELESQMKETFNLKDVFIVPTTINDLNDNIAKAAAQYIEEKVDENTYINIGYGDTVSKTLNHLIYSLEKEISLVTLSGGVSYYTSAIISGTRRSAASGITPNIHILPAPLIASSQEVANILLNESSIQSVLNMTELSSLSVVGIGAVSNEATIFKYGIANKEDLALLKMQGAVGDILSQFFDKDGNILETNLHNRLISIPLEKLRSKEQIIGVAGGLDKVQAIYSALKGNFVNILITDEDTAKALLKFKNK